MNHLSDDQLSARLDGALNASDDAAAGRHLDGCAECRDRLAALSELDASLRGALAHDPGEEYFAAFADRIGEKIAASAPAAKAVAAPSSGGLFGWWRSPRALALVGSTAAVLAVAAVALKLSSDRGVEGFAKQVAPQSEVGAPLAVQSAPAPETPAPAAKDVRAEQEGAPAPAAARLSSPPAASPRSQAPPAAERRAQSGRAVEMRTLANGEQVAVPSRELPMAAPRSVPSPPSPAAGPVRVVKPQTVSSMNSTPANPAPVLEERARDAAADAAAPVPQREKLAAPPAPAPAAPAPAAEPARKGRFDVRSLLEQRKASTPTPSPAPASSSSQSLTPPATGSSTPLGVPEQPQGFAKSYKPLTRDEGGAGFRATPYQAAVDAASQAERVAQRERSAPAWDRAAAAWAQAAALTTDEPQLLSARRSAADARMTAWRLDGTAPRRADAMSAVEAYLAITPPGRAQEEARRWKGELER